MSEGIVSLEVKRMEDSSAYVLTHCFNRPFSASPSRSFRSGQAGAATVAADGIQE